MSNSTPPRRIRRLVTVWLAVSSALALTPALHAQPAVPAPVAAAAPATQHRDLLRLLDLWLDAQQVYERVPALSAAVVIGQEVVFRKGYGSLDGAGRVPAGPDSIYSVCSISKLFTSVAVMQLVEQGRLRLDDDVGQLLPELRLQRSDPDSGPITVRALLSHAGGLPREADAAYWTAPDFVFPDRAALYARLAGQRTLWRANERQQYSNLGMALLGEVVQAASGQPYADYVQQQILGPLQMADTRPRLPLELRGRQLAEGFGTLARDGRRPPVAPFDTRALLPAAGYTSTVDDLAKFARWQLRLLQRGGTELLKVATLREMQRVQWTDPDGKLTWGLGFAVQRDGNRTVVSHSGLCPGYRSVITLVPQDQFAVIGMVNANGEPGPLGRPLRQLVAKGMRLPVASSGPGAPVLADYAGRYAAQPWGAEQVVLPWGEGLAMLELPSRDPAGTMDLLKPSGRDRFRYVREDGSLGPELVFERNAAGRVTGLLDNSQRVPRLAPLAD